MFRFLGALFILFSGALAQEKDGNARYTPLVRAVYKTMPSTVMIGSNSFNVEELGDYKVKLNKELNHLGSGVIVSESGLVLTNEHVIKGNENIRIFTFDRKEYGAKVIYSSKKEDLALLEITNFEKIKFTPVTFAWPNDLLLGEPLATIGNPLGLAFTVSQGILSSTKRRLEVDKRIVYDDLLQTDIKVNPGNSGGPLINMNGEMTGIMVGSQTKSRGIGFAIPISKIEKVLSSWLSPEKTSQSEIGFHVVTKFNQKDGTGKVVVKGVQQGRLNSLLGIKNGIVIKIIDKHEVRNAFDFYSYLRKTKTGQQVTIQTDKGKTFQIQMFPLKGLTLAKAMLGLEFERSSLEMAKIMSIPFDKGFVLTNIHSRLNNLKIQRGDMLFKIGNKAILSDADLQDVLKSIKAGTVLKVIFLRVERIGVYQMINDEIRIPLSN
jgi:S1-C subfamily serine protease